ncbi:hypothetical protein BGZ73_007704 [Actinomortierella ambigua]|nr:hypothetical protein BGZ73_007704 [Actinomortierella ambigua]
MESTEGEQLFTQIAPSPLGKINNSLKRIRLQDEEADSSSGSGHASSRSDSFEKAWGDINVGDLNDSDFEDEPLVRKVSIPEQKRHKKEDPKSPTATMNPAEKYFATHSFPPPSRTTGPSITTASSAKVTASSSSSFASTSKAGSSSSAASSSKSIFSRFFTKGPANTTTAGSSSGGSISNNNSTSSGSATASTESVAKTETASSTATSLFTSVSTDSHDDDFQGASTSTAAGSTHHPSSSLSSAPLRPSTTAVSKSTGSSFSKQKKVVTHKAKAGTRSNNGSEDVFSHEQVKHWSEVRIKTWEHRRLNVEGFYYRFCDPTEMQHNGAWSTKSKQEFMTRLEEWKQRGIRIGTSWGVFSMAVSHKAGYQCSSYYRKLLETKQLTDPNYAWEGGKLVMVNKTSGGEMAMSGLSERWETEEVKEIERNINEWIKLYHSNGMKSSAPRAPKLPSLPSGGGDSSITAVKRPTVTSSISTTSTVFRPRQEAPRVKATTAPVVHKQISVVRTTRQPSAEAEVLTSVDIDDKFAEYSSFMKGQQQQQQHQTTPSIPARPSIRETLSLHVPSNIGPTSAPPPPGRSVVSLEVRKAPVANANAKGQLGLSLFWKNIRPVRAECPDIPKYMIPKDVEQRPTWAHRIVPYRESEPVAGVVYKEVPSIVDMDWSLLSEGLETPIGDLQGIMADPPWNFIVADGRNDGKCRLTLDKFTSVMEKALELVPSGIVCVWTHKAILPDVVSVMHGLGCRYVENLVWYKLGLNNSNLDRASPYFRSSKEILLMFKRGEGFDIRHQRTADVIMDFEKPTTAWIDEDWTEPKPEAVFEMMEILLPDARFTPELGRGRLLELWAKRGQERRTGWISVHEVKEPSLLSSDLLPLSSCAVPAAVASRVSPTLSQFVKSVTITILDDDDDGDESAAVSGGEGEEEEDDDAGNVADMEDAGDEGLDRVDASEVGSPASGIQTPNTLELMDLEDGLSDFSEGAAPLVTAVRDGHGQSMDLE